MGELNARTDTGGSHWSTAGPSDLVTVKTAQLLHHPICEQLRKEILRPNAIGFDLLEEVTGGKLFADEPEEPEPSTVEVTAPG
jgi:hypothetical protein